METPLRILVAEDELGDLLLLRRAFLKAGVSTPVHFAKSGQEVIDYLQGKPPFENPVQFPLPSLLLLDLKLPLMDGFQVLTWVREHPFMRHLIVVVLSSSAQDEDVARAYELGANSYILKPEDPRELIQVVARLQRYWATINTCAEPEHSIEGSLAV